MKKVLILSLGVVTLSFAPALMAQTTSSTTTTTAPNTTTTNTSAPYFGPATYPTNPGTPGQVDDMDQVFKDNNK